MSEITSSDGYYRLTADVSDAPGVTEFSGFLDGNMHKISSVSAPLFTTLTGTVKNLVLEDVSISSGDASGNTGAIACTANGAARIYNVGILSGSVGGSGNTGGLVGYLDGTARVINCYSYADITGGTTVGGIVGYNNVATTATNLKTMVMNCMFYGNITGGDTKSPVYGGKNINNNQGGLNTFNYYSYEKLTGGVTDNQYNCALAVEDKYLNRFEFYRLLLNSNKKLAAYYATGSAENGDKMAKWVLETADRTIDNPKPYPVLKAQGYYPSIVNPDIEHAPDSASVGRNHGGKLGDKTLSVTINLGSGAPTDASITTGSLTLTRTDKDFDRFNFNYDKVQLPYYNDVGTGNYTDYKVVTGWKITAITAVEGDPYTSANYPTTGITDFPNHNYADRKSSNKDLYSVSKRVFSQGAYFDVPYGVTSITIEPYWGTAVYVADQYYDVVYKNDYTGKQGVSQVGTQAVDNTTEFNGQKVRTSITGLGSGTTVYDNAVVLVGNFHLDGVPSGGTVPFTMMSVDMDNDHEPDYSLIYHHKNRTAICPIRFDFLNIPGTAQAQKPNGASLICNFTIFKTKGWFEVTNTSSFYTSQLEYENLADVTKTDAPLILLGGVIDQFVSTQSSKVDGHTIYIHVGGNVWINSFGLGTHSDGSQSTPHVPVSVTGGEYEGLYLTGTYNAGAAVRTDNAECYISGGHIVEAAGASLEQINGSVHWQIYNADIDEFFGGGTNDAKPIKGDITTDIYNSNVGLFCGGPKFGNMQADKKVTTNAEGCIFGKYFGAGYGGTSLSRKKYYDTTTTDWPGWAGKYVDDRGKYFDGSTTNAPGDSKYGKKGPGVATDMDYEFFVWSPGNTGGRFFVKYATFSLAQCNDVSSTLKKCTVKTNFYGGGNLGKVVGTATSVLEDCTVNGSVYGAGYSASLPTVEVRDGGFVNNPNYNKQSGMFEPAELSGTTTFTWQNAAAAGKTLTNGQSGSDLSNHILYTNTVLTGLGEVAKSVLTINGTTTVAHSVYGGGEESGVAGNTEVTVTGGTIGTPNLGGAEYGNVYGGGKGKADDVTAGIVKGSTTVSISGSPTILHNVYGGGAYGSVGTFSYDATTGFPTGWNTTDDKGKCTVSITGGTIGTTGDNNGMVFGSSRGLEGDPSIPNVDKMAWVYDTEVTIGTQNAQSNATPWIKGSVYGGGENGHNFHDASVTVHSGTIGIAEGAEIIDDRGTPGDTSDDISYSGARFPNRGNVYGSGCGTDTYTGTDSKTYFDFNAGIVRGNTTVLIDGGHVVHNVYGGGAMGSVGTYTFADAAYHTAHPEVPVGKPISCADGTGTCTVTVSGGQIGVTGATMAEHGKGGPDDYGHVFGAGRGEMHDPDQYPNVETCAFFNKAILNISGTAFLTGSAYGGSESGHVLGDTEINISGGQIGCGKNATKPFPDAVWADDYTPTGESMDCASWPFIAPFAPYDPFANATGDLDKYPNGKSTDGGRLEASDGHTYYGNVFGGGSGSVPYFDTTDGISKYLSTAGSVEGKTTINITGGHIITNVYGGCEATNVKGSATITMTGGTVGVPRTVAQIMAHPNTGYIFGAGKGDQRIFFNKETNVDRTLVNIEGGRVYGSIFGGGEDGHVFQNAIVNIGKADTEGPTIGTWGTSYVDGNVFGGGRGFGGEALTAGNIGGSIELNIKSGKILGSVYGGGRLGSVGYGLYLVDEEITEDEQTIKPYGILRPNDKYDGSYPNPSTQDASAYYDKGRGYITINISGGTIGNDYEYIYNPTDEQKAAIPNTTFDYQNHLQYTKGGNVFTGGMGRLYALDNTTLLPLWPKLGKCKSTTLNMTGGTVKSSIYGGGEIGAVAENATVNVNGGTVGTKVVDSEDANKYYYFGSVFGGGKGSTAKVEGISEAGTTGGNVQVNLNETHKENGDAKGAVVSQVFGCNDMNGSPKGTVTVHVYATQNADKANISAKPEKGTDTYDVQAVYGGGNLAAYEPTDLGTGKTNVIIDGCGLTSVRQVYGGGNAASTPATNVEVNGTYEIEELFGGGNGFDKLPDGKPNPGANVGYKNYTVYEKVAEEWVAKDDPAYDTKEERTAPGSAITYGTGQASVNVFGGTVHRVFGGSNTKGNVRQTAVTLLDENSGCSFCVDEAYGGGKSAPMDAEAKLHMACIPGLQAAYGGAEAAAIKGNVTLNITNGTFDRVFGGNNLSGTIDGSITVNIQEVGCRPIKIGELYGGGNQAGYSVYGYNDDDTPKETGTKLYDDPQVNVMSFTSIGKVFGGGFGSGATMVGNPTVNVNEVYGKWYNDNTSVVGEDEETPNHYPIPSHAKGKMGAIHTVFGGGNAAKVMGNTTVNIATQAEVYIVKEVTAGEALPAGCYTRSGAGTTESPFIYTDAEGTAADGTTYYEKQDVLGADIRGDVYGGGNNAEVTGDAKVKIGKKNE
ncbi:ZmpA/ZmpB/ZmpC family metallo-endopeptidase-related protein [Prevotella lacticifex]|uniref:ZmpA/ZmpB/ZmpC family metallo-endopeptidase-related protein n=1 Tax=Prevotella lacticifex TaxID=2854755 RepID=UPI001CC62455|nr:ZmpA/ZmpB/ZmpC family metallo-endopeptidase-related protein [Prevotella lacticifex]